jgi:hypothetical protein
LPAVAQLGAPGGERRYDGGGTGTTKYSALHNINAANVKNLQIVWRWHSDNFGNRSKATGRSLRSGWAALARDIAARRRCVAAISHRLQNTSARDQSFTVACALALA